jgi:uncharacterized membrane protein YfcA
MFDYLLYFSITVIISTLFSIGGAGSAVAMIPILNFLGVHLDLAKAVGLFANTASTVGASIMNLKRAFVDVKQLFPFISTSIISAPIGAKIATLTDIYYIKVAFALFLLVSATLMLRTKKESKKDTKTKIKSNTIVFLFSGIIIGLLAGILGIGGGALIVPLLIYLGYDAKKVAMMLSFIIPFSTTSAFIMYTYLIQIDWTLIIVVASGALLGGVIGNHLMVYKIDAKQMKKVIATLLYIVAIKMIIELF